MKSSKVIAGVLAGVAAGVVLGILFAPDKGSNTRKKIVETGSDLKDSLKDKINDFVDELADQYENIKDKKENMMEADVEHSMS